jgi:hypothetical protein
MRQLIIVTSLSLLFLTITFSQSSREINKTISLKLDGRLSIDTYKGTITITTHDKPIVEVNVKIEADDQDSHFTSQDVEDTEIEFLGTEKSATIHTNYSRLERNNYHDFWDRLVVIGENFSPLPLVHYTIKMPRTAELRIKDYKSKSYIEGLTSNLIFNSYKGTVEVLDLKGGVDLETYKGDVRISFSKLERDSHFETYKGNISVTLPKETSFILETNFERRVDFNSDFDVEVLKRDKKHRHYDYAGNFNGGGPTLEFSSTKGNIQLREK